MQEGLLQQLKNRLPNMNLDTKLLLCDVGSDTYHNSKHPLLIDQVWRWARENSETLHITEHNKRL